MKNTQVKRLLSVCLLMLLLAACSDKQNQKIVGIWKLNTLEVNGVSIQGESLGNWLWEFNEEGGYLINVAGAIEKGRYTFDKNNLTLKSITSKDRPEQHYTVEKLDSTSLNLTSVTDKNTSKLNFVKIDEGELGEKD